MTRVHKIWIEKDFKDKRFHNLANFLDKLEAMLGSKEELNNIEGTIKVLRSIDFTKVNFDVDKEALLNTISVYLKILKEEEKLKKNYLQKGVTTYSGADYIIPDVLPEIGESFYITIDNTLQKVTRESVCKGASKGIFVKTESEEVFFIKLYSFSLSGFQRYAIKRGKKEVNEQVTRNMDTLDLVKCAFPDIIIPHFQQGVMIKTDWIVSPELKGIQPITNTNDLKNFATFAAIALLFNIEDHNISNIGTLGGKIVVIDAKYSTVSLESITNSFENIINHIDIFFNNNNFQDEEKTDSSTKLIDTVMMEAKKQINPSEFQEFQLEILNQLKKATKRIIEIKGEDLDKLSLKLEDIENEIREKILIEKLSTILSKAPEAKSKPFVDRDLNAERRRYKKAQSKWEDKVEKEEPVQVSV